MKKCKISVYYKAVKLHDDFRSSTKSELISIPVQNL